MPIPVALVGAKKVEAYVVSDIGESIWYVC